MMPIKDAIKGMGPYELHDIAHHAFHLQGITSHQQWLATSHAGALSSPEYF